MHHLIPVDKVINSQPNAFCPFCYINFFFLFIMFLAEAPSSTVTQDTTHTSRWGGNFFFAGSSCEKSRLIKKAMNIHGTLVLAQLITYSERLSRRSWCEWPDWIQTHWQLNKTQIVMFHRVTCHQCVDQNRKKDLLSSVFTKAAVTQISLLYAQKQLPFCSSAQ